MDTTQIIAFEHQLDHVDLEHGWRQAPIERAQLRPFITTNIQTKASLLPPQRLTCFHTSTNLLGKLPKRPDAVNAFLAYSRGQLALAPCTHCSENYELHGSALPFPDCVFLPTYWGFACASCIARHRAVECSFNILRTEYRDLQWEKTQIRIDEVGAPGSKWLERGHTLSTFDPQSLNTIWKRCRHAGSGLAHDLAQPLQEPSFVYPPEVPNARLPDNSRQASCPSDPRDPLSILKEKLSTKRHIIVITGAGVSTNAGIPDFRSASRSKKSSLIVYDSSAYSTQASADRLNDDVLLKLQSGRSASFTPFDTFAEDLARSGRLRRHYTQNIDCRHTRLPFLSQRTMWLHGRADTLACHLRPSHTRPVTPRSFRRLVMAPCPSCRREGKKRATAGMRRRAEGFLRPKVLLYGEHCPDEVEITAAFNGDLKQPIDAVLIVGTRLSIGPLGDFASRLCKVVRASSRENLVVWVSKEPPKCGEAFRSLISVEYLGDCDDFASIMSR